MFLKRFALLLVLLAPALAARANHIFIPMDNTQKEHLKAYGLCYWALSKQIEIDWLLNYRGGSFACDAQPALENELNVRGITFQTISEAQYTVILQQIADPNANMDVMKLEKVPKIAVYTPKGKQPWDDAVTLVLTYAEIPYDQIYDDEVLSGVLPKYDWLHLHHEDFTGEYGKFFATYRYAPWYQQQQRDAEAAAKRNGFRKVSEMKAAETVKMQEFIAGGGFMFAMCSATDSYDIALAGLGIDMVAEMYDGDQPTPTPRASLTSTVRWPSKTFSCAPTRWSTSIPTSTCNRRSAACTNKTIISSSLPSRPSTTRCRRCSPRTTRKPSTALWARRRPSAKASLSPMSSSWAKPSRTARCATCTAPLAKAPGLSTVATTPRTTSTW